MTMKPIDDRAEVVLDFPEKTYMGSFTHASRFEAVTERDGVVLKLAHAAGEKRVIEVHLHWYLFAAVLQSLAVSIEAARPELDEPHRAALGDAADAIAHALRRPGPDVS
jgi:hypothetical protein